MIMPTTMPPRTSNAPTNAYLRTKVMTASPEELRLMLFDGAIRFAEMGKAGLAARDYERSFEGISRCQDILLELINSLRPEHDPDLCRNLSSLYTFMYTRLIEASHEREPAKVDEVLELLRYERGTWSMLMERLAAENTASATMTDLPHAPSQDGKSGSTLSIQG